jgi:hypothetical protein
MTHKKDKPSKKIKPSKSKKGRINTFSGFVSLKGEDGLYPGEVVINDNNYHEYFEPVVDGKHMKRGLNPRNFNAFPVGCYKFAKPFDLPLIQESEWQGRLDAQIAARAQLSDIRDRMGPGGAPIPSRDQNGKGYCWAHSSTSAALICNAIAGNAYADFSAYAVACIIKGYRDQGGWGAESLEWIAANGLPTSKTWPQQSMSRSNDNPAMRAEAAKHKYTEWMDLADGGATVKQQLVTALLCGLPVVVDYNWWSHSVCALDLVSISPFKIRIWNSWGDSWSANGTGILEGNKAIPNGALAARVISPAQP